MSAEQKLAFASSCSVAFPCQVFGCATRAQAWNVVLFCRGGMHSGFPASLPQVMKYRRVLRWRVLAHSPAYHACSLWREVGTSICGAPLEYEAWIKRWRLSLFVLMLVRFQGPCSVRLDAGSMSEEEKYTWSSRCGARLGVCTSMWLHQLKLLMTSNASGGRALR